MNVRQFIETKLDRDKLLKIGGRIVLGALFFIAGFNFSYTAFFRENPIFGVPYLAEVLISLAAGVFGFHTVPILAVAVKEWFESVVAKTVSRVVSDFWDQQSKRMEDARRDKQKKKKEEREKKMKEEFSNAVLLDTSVLIDGRLLDIVKTGFLESPFIVTESVIDELQLISDNEDTLKRQRGRRGLDVLKDLKKEAKVYIFKKYSKAKGVDKELVNIAKKYKIRLMTLDYNLNKVAKVSGIKVLNINDLVNAVKTEFLPGESLAVKIVQEGKEKNQGVGYLEDGTMVVVEEARNMVDKEVQTTVSRVIQTPAGKMVFCELITSG